MSEFQIKAEKLAERCEVCHKTDCYDPKTNYCSRCAKAAIPEETGRRPGGSVPQFLSTWMRLGNRLDLQPVVAVTVLIGGLCVIGAIFGFSNLYASKWNFQERGMQNTRPVVQAAPVSPGLKRLPPSAGYNPTLALFTDTDDRNLKALEEVVTDEPSLIKRVETLEEAVKSDADIIILLLKRSDRKTVSTEAIELLKKQKVIGIGYGAAELFGKLGLEINAGACGHGSNSAPVIRLEQNKVMGEWKSGETLTAFNISSESTYGDNNFAMYIHRKSSLSSVVDVIARWGSDENYAPLVRQGNYILSGLAAPASTWTPEYKNYFRTLVNALHAHNQEPFQRAKWAATYPGTYSLKLASSRSIDELPSWTYYFQFSRATKFTAKLDQMGSDNVMMLFMGEGKQRIRKDIRAGENGEISVSITDEDLKAIKDGYWSLKIANFDLQNRAECTLKIEYPREAVLEE